MIFCKLSQGEGFGFAWDAFARGTTLTASLFMQIALLEVAENIAEDDELKVWGAGFKASSLLTILMTVTGLVIAVLMPIVGAIVDSTSKRWALGAGGALGLTLCNAAYITLSETSFWFCVIVSIFGSFFFYLHFLAVMSYLPELFEEEKDTNFINYYSNVLLFTSQIISIFGIIMLAAMMGYEEACKIDNDVDEVAVEGAVNVTRNCTLEVHAEEELNFALGMHLISQLWAVVVGGGIFAVVWLFYMEQRPALHKETEGGGMLITRGYKKLAKTYALFQGPFQPCRTFLITVTLSEAAAVAFATIAVTYMKEELEMSPSETSSVMGIAIVTAIPGSVLAAKISQRCGFLNSQKYALLFWTTCCMTFSAIVRKENYSVSYYFGVLWGIGFGWIYPIQRNVWYSIVPAGYESEMTGVYLFAGNVITWLPPLVYSVLNQADAPMRYGVVANGLFFFTAFLIVHFSLQKNYDKVVEESTKTRHRRVMSQTSGLVKSRLQVVPIDNDGDGDDVEGGGEKLLVVENTSGSMDSLVKFGSSDIQEG
mmetsp:Transcript_2408/g.5000  ORF Transcript_2408/g.5000 Transcript_2408/m.5000 type:complete len:539 (+) Transcript_2408:58-1674(+)|eukprot:CAMPEP_0118638558 /NCGR_PEP_ID=MMETSP0785-20121206/3753_1 /TAXON_ID=91992 /ORGANISM="Bolidomonas pacifica, Strain CCMP 1866" /LENGTH=538 /DNA_ID=CAMNT_0006529825 /DNA_START=46 /DNA_END=1662 /DNA_ORIENTATION=-